nr:hypothetical protein [Tanacetum cinerariifolium]
SGPDWLFDIDVLTRTMNYEPITAGAQSNGFVDMPALEDISTFNLSSDHEDDDEEADMNNMDTTIQMDVKIAFLYGNIKEEVYVCQLPVFEDPDFPDKVYNDEKELYGLHQAPKARYKTLLIYLLDNRFHRGKIDKNLFIRRHKDDILLVQVYVDDIIFGELTFFLAKILKKYGFPKVKNASTPMETQKPLLKDEDSKEVDVHMYRSMIGSLMYLTSSRPDIMFAPTECKGFEQIVDFLNVNPIKYALTVNPAVYISCTEQFLATVKAKTINEEGQSQALVDGKKVIITESTIRRDLQLEDDEGVDCLSNVVIFKQLTLMGYEKLSHKLTFYMAFFS